MDILIIDDDIICRELLHTYLKPYGECYFAENGKEAIEQIQKKISEKKMFNLIFLDIMMPELNGHDVLKKVHELEQKHHLNFKDNMRIIMTTALGDSKNVLSAFSEGCEYYLVKPIQKRKLEEILEKVGIK